MSCSFKTPQGFMMQNPPQLSQVLNCVCMFEGRPRRSQRADMVHSFLDWYDVVQFCRWRCLVSLSIFSILFLLVRLPPLSQFCCIWCIPVSYGRSMIHGHDFWGKVGTWGQHHQQLVQDLSKAISDHTKYRTEELTPFATRRAFVKITRWVFWRKRFAEQKHLKSNVLKFE